MLVRTFLCGLLALCMTSCSSPQEQASYSDVKVVGAMRNVMWKGELGSQIDLDTISNKVGLYGLGPETFLAGEVLILDGTPYRSTVATDTSMTVEKNVAVSAPFFVYANVSAWTEEPLPGHIRTIQELEAYLDAATKEAKRPFAFQLNGRVSHARIHVQNLPPGTPVSSPQEAHQGQVSYQIEAEAVRIVGFFSTEHKGVFTHHDSFLHMHLLTADERMMGHLDEVAFEAMQLSLPKR